MSSPISSTPAEIAAARETLAGAEFVDGRATAGWHAGWSRTTSRLPAPTGASPTSAKRSSAKIGAHPLFRLAARPKALAPLILSRYEPGMEYGSHVDDALMNGMRTDVSFTLFLGEPDTYEGGALVIETAAARRTSSCRPARSSPILRRRSTASRR